MKLRFWRRQSRRMLVLESLLVLPLILLGFQNCSSGFTAETLDENYTRQLRLSLTRCTANNSESYPVGAVISGYAHETVNFPSTCEKIAATCQESGEWDGPVPAFKACQQQCLNPDNGQLEACPVNPTPPKSVTALPSWRKGMKAWEWKKIDGSDISSVSPSVTVPGDLSARIDAHSGFATDRITNKIYSVANGGGTDYAGNEIYEIDLSSEAPQWRLLREPTASDLISAGDSSKGLFNDYYKDNRPSSSHSYYSLQFVSIKQSIFRFGAGSTWGTGQEGNVATDVYSVPFNDWFAPKTYPDILTERSNTKDVSICKNPLTEDVYINLDRIRKFNPITGVYTQLSPPLPGGSVDDTNGGGCAVDTKRNKILYFKNNQIPTDGGLVYDIKTDKLEAIHFSGPAFQDVRDATAGYGYYDPTFDVYIFKDHKGGKVLRINPETFEAHEVITVGGDAIPDAINGVYTRFTQLPNLKGYAYYPQSGSGFWFLATE